MGEQAGAKLTQGELDLVGLRGDFALFKALVLVLAMCSALLSACERLQGLEQQSSPSGVKGTSAQGVVGGACLGPGWQGKGFVFSGS